MEKKHLNRNTIDVHRSSLYRKWRVIVAAIRNQDLTLNEEFQAPTVVFVNSANQTSGDLRFGLVAAEERFVEEATQNRSLLDGQGTQSRFPYAESG